MILNEHLESTSRINTEAPLETKNTNNKSSSSKTNKLQQQSTNSRNIKILKSYYKKDALASVTKSFLTLDENYYKVNSSNTSSSQNQFKDLSKLSIGALSVATTATANSDSGASVDTCFSFNSSCSNKYQK
jgi:hypothetical protein